MRFPFILTLAAVVAACGRSNEEQLQEAANQSDPAAAAVLNNAAEAGTPPQEALEQAGEAAARANIEEGPPSGSVQARPNEASNPNPRQAGEPPDKVVVNSD
jgi:hypothetical protein